MEARLKRERQNNKMSTTKSVDPPETEVAVQNPASYAILAVSNDDDKDWKKCCRSCAEVQLPPLRVLITLIACVFVEATLGITYTTGNLTPYLTSYLRNVTEETSLDYSQTLWISNSLWLVLATTTAGLGLVERKIPNRLYLFIGLGLNGVAIFGTYWAVQTSFALTVVLYGVVQGLAQAILYPGCVRLALQWFPNKKGLMGGITLAGYGGGAFIWNQVVTLWINPDNLQPDLTMDENLYFTQDEVLGRVPSCFLLLGGILTGVQLLCLLSITYPPPHTASSSPLTPDVTEGNSAQAEDREREEEISQDRDFETSEEKGKGEPATDSVTQPAVDSPFLPATTAGVSERSLCQEKTTNNFAPDYSPLQVLTSRVTWTLWLANFSTDVAFFFIPTFYKAYGQTFIHDDHLLSLVASFASAFNAVCRPLWGMVGDRIGYLPCLLISSGILTFMSATLVLCETAGSSAMFFIWVCGIYVAFSGIYALQCPVIFTLFGHRNFVFSLGVVCCTGAISTFITVPLASAVSGTFGWHGVFLVAAAGAFSSMLFLCSLLVNCGHPIPRHMRRGLLAPRRCTKTTESSTTADA